MDEHQANGPMLQHAIQKRPAAGLHCCLAAGRAGYLPDQPAFFIERQFQHHLAPKTAEMGYQRLQDISRERPDATATRDQSCHEGSSPCRRSRQRCRIVPIAIAASARKVGVPRMTA